LSYTAFKVGETVNITQHVLLVTHPLLQDSRFIQLDAPVVQANLLQKQYRPVCSNEGRNAILPHSVKQQNASRETTLTHRT
jgi:hypothetical protein